MSIASNTKQRRFEWGGRAFHSKFPTHGELSVIGSIAGGSRLAKSEEFADAHAAMLLEGTSTHAKAQIQELLDDIGASLSFHAESDRLAFQGHARAKHAKKLMALIVEVLKEPTFAKKEIEVFKEKRAAELSLESQDTHEQAQIGLSRALYEPGHPNHAESTDEAQAIVRSLSRKALTEYHSRSIDRKSLVVSIVSDTSADETFALINSFSKLPSRTIDLPAFQPAKPEAGTVVEKHIADKASVDLFYGIATGIGKSHEDYPALFLGMQILGNSGGSTGRLMRIVREQEGLTYGAYAYLAGFQRSDGNIAVWGTFAAKTLERGKESFIREIKRLATEGSTAQEVGKYRAMYAARSKVLLSSSIAIAREVHATVLDGNSLSYLDEFPAIVAKLTARQVNAALKKYLIPEMLSKSAAGPIGTIDKEEK